MQPLFLMSFYDFPGIFATLCLVIQRFILHNFQSSTSFNPLHGLSFGGKYFLNVSKSAERSRAQKDTINRTEKRKFSKLHLQKLGGHVCITLKIFS